ncbi:methyl-accepting chemotaxis protein, partial [Aduncisulcus paluster]
MPSDYDPTSRPWYTQAVEEDKIIWTDPYTDATSGELVISAAAPVYTASGKITGVVAIDLNLDALSSEISGINIGKTGYPVIIAPDGTTIVHRSADVVGKAIPIEELADFVANNSSGSYTYNWQDVDKIAVLQTIERLNWKV